MSKSTKPKLKLTKKERSAIEELRNLQTRWPDSLWLFSASGRLWVMKYGEDGKKVMLPSRLGDGGADPDYSVCQIDIPNDGGDW